jgi:DNA-binding NarL/FixJ family response regulator
MTVTILIVDDHPLIRQGLRNILDAETDFEVIGEAEDGVEALRLIDLLKPDVLTVDMLMPNLNGLEVLQQINKLSPSTLALVLSMQSADAYVADALRLGAAGYILKDTAPLEIVKAIRQALQGKIYLSDKLSARLEAAGQKVEQLPPDAYQLLTMREREILQMTAEGRSSTQIGEKLAISHRTVEIHRSNLMKKLGFNNQADLIRFAIRRGILPDE